MSPDVAWDDQARAATQHVRRVTKRMAERGQLAWTLERMPRGVLVIQDRFNRFMSAGPEGQVACCEHLHGGSPQPVTWSAWEPDVLQCMSGSLHPSPGEPENHTCDACRRYAPKTLVPYTKQIGFVMVFFGLCARCRKPVDAP